METTVQVIPLTNLGLSFIPVLLALLILIKWSLNAGNALYSIIRMLIQLVLVGYLLVYIFEYDHVWITLGVIAVMIIVSSWIGLRTLNKMRIQLFLKTIIASLCGGGTVLLIIIWPVLELEPLHKPQYTIPLAGMIFANSMNTISLALERLDSELRNGAEFIRARSTAMHTAMIPIINSMFAVGLVSLPGMMTGQVLSGVSPLIAVRYQIVVMCMIFASAVFSTAILMLLGEKKLNDHYWQKAHTDS